MVVALLALSSVMILGGIAAVVQGFPYVRLESGLAMVIGGSTAASAGVVLLGLTAVVHRLLAIQRVVADRRAIAPQPVQAGLPAAAAPWADTAAEAPVPAVPEVQPPERPSLVGTGGSGMGGAGMGAAGIGAAGLAGLSLGALRPGGRGSEPVFEDPAPPQPSAAEPLLPDLLPEATPRPTAADDLFRAPEPAPTFPEPEPITLPESSADSSAEPAAEAREDARNAAETLAAEPIGLRSSLDEPAPAPEPEAPAAAFESAPEPVVVEPVPPEAEAEQGESEEAATEERHAVGSYASGANTYVMFSDGSIEADTPRGRFTFGSLDELKSFVNAGGEEARGAA
ncbi:hypothetical protein [Methylorubrum thiocyanatum]|uniref:Uncharacterized protein n=1 Tax=Methylorubrum thiocyanatum TaxID=47958 RepID=A0AA40S274_9HYPH|nr:hypothetical protein [Methylorubrum thiocyanatum]MBA8913128.1 hypothetical protein [Methylorubrum thiocyanatum]GJE83096.1 hypothetical protein CJNNKLLH_4465 [Methylorubrum thiocyanatum]